MESRIYSAIKGQQKEERIHRKQVDICIDKESTIHPKNLLIEAEGLLIELIYFEGSIVPEFKQSLIYYS